MAEVGQAYVSILPSARGFGPKLSKQLSPELGTAGKESGKKLGAGVTEGAKSQVSGLGKAMGAVIGGGLALATVGFFKGAINSASDLNETVSKSSVIFGDNAADIQKWASTAAKSLGLSQQAALDSASSFGDMFSQIGFAGGQAADMSKQVVQLATDLGSFNNLPTAEVLDSLSGAFRGEYDSLQRVIPNISAARVEQEALNATHKKSVGDLTAAEKATATLAIVQKDGARASGDFARTSGGLANQTKIAKAEFSDLQAEIGTKLLPVLTKGLSAGLATADWIDKNQKLALLLAGTIGGLVVTVKAVDAAQKLWATSSTIVNAANKLMTRSTITATGAIKAEGVAASTTAKKTDLAAASTGRFSAKSLATVGAIGAVVTAAEVGGRALNTYIERNNAAAKVVDSLGKSTDSFTTALVNNGGKVDDNVRSLIQAQLAETGLADKAAKAGITTDQMSAAILGGAQSTLALVDAWKAGGKPSNDTIFALEALAAGYAQAKQDGDKAIPTINGVGGAASKGADNTNALKDATKSVTDNMIKEKDAAGLLTAAMDKLNGKTATADQANITFKNGVFELAHKFDDAKASGDAYSTTLNTNTQSGRDNWQAVKDQIDAAKTHAAAVANQTGSVLKGAEAQRADEAAIRAAAVAAGLNATEVDKMIAKYGQVPSVVSTEIQLKGLAGLQQVFDSLKQPRVLEVFVNAHGGGHYNDPDFRAGGGQLNLSKWTVVGENGPELIAPGGMVYTNRQTQKMLGSVSPASAPIYVQNPWTGEYHLAQMANVADQRVASGLHQLGNDFTYNS